MWHQITAYSAWLGFWSVIAKAIKWNCDATIHCISVGRERVCEYVEYGWISVRGKQCALCAASNRHNWMANHRVSCSATHHQISRMNATLLHKRFKMYNKCLLHAVAHIFPSNTNGVKTHWHHIHCYALINQVYYMSVKQAQCFIFCLRLWTIHCITEPKKKRAPVTIANFPLMNDSFFAKETNGLFDIRLTLCTHAQHFRNGSLWNKRCGFVWANRVENDPRRLLKRTLNPKWIYYSSA